MEKPSFTLQHVGINTANQEEALALVELFCQVLGFSARFPDTGAPFAGDGVEVMPGTGRGSKGHLAFYTPDISAAVAYLESQGVELDPSSVRYNSDGSLYLIYLRQEIGGFAIHILTDKR